MRTSTIASGGVAFVAALLFDTAVWLMSRADASWGYAWHE